MSYKNTLKLKTIKNSLFSSKKKKTLFYFHFGYLTLIPVLTLMETSYHPCAVIDANYAGMKIFAVAVAAVVV